MEAVADFAASEMGRFYGDVCARWNVDPAASFDDDVLAYNLRAALAMSLGKRDQDKGPKDDPFERTRREAEAVRQQVGD